ncbi:MAG: carbohydrate kinase family protein [Candidatus Paceibacterota bacterium]|jgi:ribokinase
MFDVVTFGSATLDIEVLMPKNIIRKDNRSISGKAYCFNLGSKLDVNDMYFGFGGGGVNTAVTFKKQGFRTAYCGMVGQDILGQEIIEYLNERGIDSSLVKKTGEKLTNNSVIMDSVAEDRTVLAYRGASELLKKEDIPEDLRASWFYLAPLSGKLSGETGDILAFARKNGIKTAANLGNSQIKMPKTEVREILGKIDVLILNKEEASNLTNIDYGEEREIILKLAKIHSGISVMTKGKDGVVVISGKKTYEAKLKKFKIIDETGAGDSFGSGFISGLIRTGDIEYSIRLGLTNSKYALLIRGATTGLLGEKDNHLVEEEGINVKTGSISI